MCGEVGVGQGEWGANGESEASALVGVAGEVDGAAEEMGELAAEGEAEADAAFGGLAAEFGLGKWFENEIMIGGMDAGAGVGDGELDKYIVGGIVRGGELGDVECNRAGRGEFEGIV